MFASSISVDRSAPIINDCTQPVKKFEVDGLIYGTCGRSKRNSFVLFTTANGNTSAGQIFDIFQHARREDDRIVVEPFFVVKVFQPLREDLHPHDLYHAFPDLDTKLYLAEFEPFLHVLRLDQIMCHFAAFFYVPQGIEQKCVVRSLD